MVRVALLSAFKALMRVMPRQYRACFKGPKAAQQSVGVKLLL
jgi:hypothetical protein